MSNPAAGRRIIRSADRGQIRRGAGGCRSRDRHNPTLGYRGGAAPTPQMPSLVSAHIRTRSENQKASHLLGEVADRGLTAALRPEAVIAASRTIRDLTAVMPAVIEL